jgi:hypothetical protein
LNRHSWRKPWTRAQIDGLPGLGAADELEGLVHLLLAHHSDRHRRRRRLLRLLRGYARLLLASGEQSEGHAQRRGGRGAPSTSSRGRPLHRSLETACAESRRLWRRGLPSP